MLSVASARSKERVRRGPKSSAITAALGEICGLEEYWRRRDEIEDERFRFAWRRIMCRTVPPEAFALLDALPDPGHDIHQGHHLRRYAARLGNEWALAVAERNEEEVWGPVD